MNIKDDPILSKINKGYLVGGSTRDFLLKGTIPCDRDIAIKDAEKFAKSVANEFDGTLVVLDEVNKIYRVVLQDKINYLDISEMVGETIEEDLLRRDFTINAIAYDLGEEKFIDITEGLSDLKNGVLRHIKDSNFEDDPLRILRAFRFLSVTGFKMSESLKLAILKYKHLLLNPSKERIMYEIMKLFGGKYCSDTLLIMDKFEILEKIFPFVNELKQVPKNSHHHLDLFHQVTETVNQIEIFYENSPDVVREHLDKTDFGGFPRINHLKLAGFMHDIGKFSTWTIEEYTGRHRFIKHDDLGSKMCVPFLRDLKFSKKQIEYISCMIKNHIYPSGVISAPDLSDKVKMRYLRKMEDNVIDNILLAKADRLSARGPEVTQEMIDNNLNGLDELLEFYIAKKDNMKPLPKLLDGFEVMKIKQIKASPKLGEIMSALHEAQISGDVNSREEAVEFISAYKI